MNHKFISYQKGFTMIELLVGIAVAMMVMTAASALFLTLFSSNARNKQREEMEQVKYDIANELTNAVRWALTIDLPPNLAACRATCNCEITTNSTSDPLNKVKYKLDSNRLVKDNGSKPLSGENVEMTCFKIYDRAANPNLQGLELILEFQHKQFNAVKDVLKISVSQRKTTL